MNTAPVRAEDIVKRAGAIGSYYGFDSFATVAAAKRPGGKAPFPESLSLDSLDQQGRDVAQFLKQVRDAGLTPSAAQPLFLWHTNAAAGRPAPKNLVIQFHALGAERAIADAVLMRAIRALMSDTGKGAAVLRINSMGDKETRSRFARELTTFFRKHAATLPEPCTTCAKRDVFEAAELLVTLDANSLPTPTDHLSEQSRKHFESVIEYLESSDTPYELAPELLSRGGTWTETCFQVTGEHGNTAWGSRYAELSKHFFKSSVPGMSAILRFTTEGKTPMPVPKKAVPPRFVFVHIGDEAKRESMRMADTLRHARIPLLQSIGLESLTQQMQVVETINPAYVIIMGRKEALERSVILRHRASYTETFIPLDSLVDRLKAVL